ncbi:MAG TPA: hypothetical protein VHD31_01255 [Candidatus Paceibacterota bacterium]|nr:hypothetical protein [Candidatus Paceibacterota bacterium]
MYVFFDHPQFIVLSLAILGLIMLGAIWDRRYMLWYVVAFVLGPIILDIPGTYFGLWSFGTPDILGFPFWLPLFYGNLTISFLYFVRTYKATID